MAWIRNGIKTLSSPGDDIDITTLTAYKFNTILMHTIVNISPTRDHRVTFNDTNSGWSHRYWYEYERFTSSLTYDDWTYQITNDRGDAFTIVYSINPDGNEKLLIGFTSTIKQTTSQNGKRQFVSKWANTSQFTRIDLHNNGASADYDTGSNLTLIGTD